MQGNFRALTNELQKFVERSSNQSGVVDKPASTLEVSSLDKNQQQIPTEQPPAAEVTLPKTSGVEVLEDKRFRNALITFVVLIGIFHCFSLWFMLQLYLKVDTLSKSFATIGKLEMFNQVMQHHVDL